MVPPSSPRPTIVFLHTPDFYAAVEQADDASLRGQPVIVGGDPRKRGSVTSASREARERGVYDGMEVAEALALCPGARLRTTRLKRYREVAAQVRDLVRDVTDRIEEVGLDGTFLQPAVADDPVKSAAGLCVRIQAGLGVPAVAGIAPTRFAAHLAARHVGPGGILRVREDELQAFIDRQGVEEIWGLGPATAARLAERGVITIGQLRQLELEVLREIAGRNAGGFLDLARGLDDRPLRPMPRSKSLSQERTLNEPSADLRALGDQILDLAAQLEAVLVRERRAARTVTLGVGYVDGTQVTRTQTVEQGLERTGEIGELALQLLARTQAGVRQVRRVRLQLSNLGRAEQEAGPEQLRLL